MDIHGKKEGLKTHVCMYAQAIVDAMEGLFLSRIRIQDQSIYNALPEGRRF